LRKTLIVLLSLWKVVTGSSSIFEETPAEESAVTLMSYLTPGKLEVGYSLTRKRRERGYRREELTRFGRIRPTRRLSYG